MLAQRIEALLAYKGYGADDIREELAKASVEAVIPAKSNAASRYCMIERNTASTMRLFNDFKNQLRVATRYNMATEPHLGFVALASVTLWLPFVHEA